MNRIDAGALVYYQFEHFSAVRHGVFTRLGGVSAAPYGALNVGGTVGDDPAAVQENYRRLYAALALDDTQACSVWQVHSADTVIVSEPVPGRRWVAKADGMVTNKPGVPLVMRYADCVPVLLHDPVQQVIGIAHAGWRGTVQGAGVSVLRVMADAFGSNPADVRAGIGPSIGPDCYQVGEEVVEAVQTYFGTVDGLVKRHPDDGSAYLNLWEANERDLRRNGVQHIAVAGICTASNTHEFHSHRAEKGKTGRFAAVIAL